MMKKTTLRTLALLGSCAVPAMAAAQTDAEAAPIALEEVIVTAQKKAESLQDTPISLTAFSEERLDVDGVNNLADIGSKVPSLTIEPFPINNATLRIFIRGIGISDTQVTQDPPVGIYVDGVYVARATGTALDVADLQRIEILRGPQGTLYGRNTTGGAINMITKRPSTEAVEAKAKLTAGNFGLLTTKGTLNVPVTDSLAIKLGGIFTQQDGFVENTGPGEDFGDKEVTGYRLDLRWNINDLLTLDYSYDKSDFEFVNTPYQSISLANANSDKGQADAIKLSAAAESAPASTSRQDKLASGMPMELSTNEIEGHALTLIADFDAFQLKYIAAYRELSDRSYAELGGGGGSTEYRLDSHKYCGAAAQAAENDGFVTLDADGCTALTVPKVDQEQWSHEFQISGDLFDSRVEYIAGLYYFMEEATEDNTPLHHQLSAPVDGAGGIRIVNMLSQKYDIENDAIAVFGQFTWTPPVFEDRLHLTFGARHSEDERWARKSQLDETYLEDIPVLGTLNVKNPAVQALAGGLGLQLPGDRTFDNIEVEKTFKDDSFSFVAEFDITDDINVYGKVIEAYKSGGFNTRDPHRDAAHEASEQSDPDKRFGVGFADGFDEEKVLSYEIGVKSELLDRRLRINADVFLSEFTDMQLNFLLSGTVADTKVINSGEAEMLGFEADITYLYSRSLLFTLNYAYLDTEVTKATDPTGRDVSDDFVFFSAPENSFTASVDWTIKEADWGRLALNVSHNYMDERNGGANANRVMTGGDPNRGTHLDEYNLTNARLGVSDMQLFGGSLAVAGWVKNITDEEYAVTAVENLPHHDKGVLWGTPRSYGVDVIYEY